MNIVNNVSKPKTEDKVNVELNRDIANRLLKMKNVGDSYSDIIGRLLDGKKEK